MPEVRAHERVFVLVGGEDGAAHLCETLVENGLGKVKLSIGERLSYPDEKITTGTAEALRGGAFAVVMRADKPRLACNERNCPWRCNAKDYCVWPSCFKQTITSKPIYPILNDDELALSADDDAVSAAPVATEDAING